jgi:hypothetical protein
MVRTLGLALASLLFLSVQYVTPASAQADWPICGPSVHKQSATERLWSQFHQLTQWQNPQSGTADQALPLQPPDETDVPIPRARPIEAPQPACVDPGETRISYFGFEHCRLHPYYQQVFPTAGCNCSTGQCRPTVWRSVTPTPDNPEGVQVKVSGEWTDVPPEVLHKFYATGSRTLPTPLLEYDAHVCAVESRTYNPVSKVTTIGKPRIECAWIDSGT